MSNQAELPPLIDPRVPEVLRPQAVVERFRRLNAKYRVVPVQGEFIRRLGPATLGCCAIGSLQAGVNRAAEDWSVDHWLAFSSEHFGEMGIWKEYTEGFDNEGNSDHYMNIAGRAAWQALVDAGLASAEPRGRS